jgi:hypothetical protein
MTRKLPLPQAGSKTLIREIRLRRLSGSFERFVGQNDRLFPPKFGFAESPDGYLNKEIN